MASNEVELDAALDQLRQKLSDPVIANALSLLVDQAGLLAFLLQGVDEFLARGDVIADSLADGFGELRAVTAETRGGEGVHLGELASNFAKLTVSLSESSPAIAELLDSGMFTSEVVQLLATVAASAVEARGAVVSGPPKIRGTYSLIKSLKDPEVQRGLNYAIEFAGALGRKV
ncbi:MAG: DUF1641 domain-containing protein [Ferrimicrobium sp.]